VPASTRYAPESVVLPAPASAAAAPPTAVPASRAAPAPSRLPIGALIFAGGALMLGLSAVLVVIVLVFGSLGGFGSTPAQPEAERGPTPVAALAEPATPVVAPVAEPVTPVATPLATPTPRPPVEAAAMPPRVTPKNAPKSDQKEPPARPAPASGEVRVSGTVESLTLHANGRIWTPGTVPEGTYEVRFTFAGRSEQQLSDVRVRAGEQTLLVCDARFANCSVR